MVATVLAVPVSLAPRLVEKWYCAGICCLDSIAKDDRLRDDVIVDVAGAKATSLALALEHHVIPVPASDGVDAARRMPPKGLTSWSDRTDGSTEARALRQTVHLGRQPSGPPSVAVAQEEDVLVGGIVSVCTGSWEASLSEWTSWSVDRTIRAAESVGIATLPECTWNEFSLSLFPGMSLVYSLE